MISAFRKNGLMLFVFVLSLQIEIRIAKNPGTNLGQRKGRLEN